MSTTRINELPAAAGVASNDFLAIDNTSGVSQKITAAQLVHVDNTLSVAGRPADAKATGDAISAEAAARESVGTEVDELKSALDVEPIIPIVWERGRLSTSGLPVATNYAIRSKYFIPVDNNRRSISVLFGDYSLPSGATDFSCVIHEYSSVNPIALDSYYVHSIRDGNFVHVVAQNTVAVKISILYAPSDTYVLTPDDGYLITPMWAKDGLSALVSDIKAEIGNTALPTTAQTITGAIAEHETDITNFNNTLMFGRSNVTLRPYGNYLTSDSAINIFSMPMNAYYYAQFSRIKTSLLNTNMPDNDWDDSDLISVIRSEARTNVNTSIITLYNYTKTRKLEMLYVADSVVNKYRWITGATINNNTNNYTINQYANEYNVSSTPSITTDTNNYLQPTGDQTDMASAIVTMLTQTGVCNLAPGTFYVSGVDMPDNTMIRGSGVSTNIVLLNSVSDGYAIKMGSNCIVEDIKISGGTSAPTITSSIGTRHGIIWQGTATATSTVSSVPARGTISNVHLLYFSGSGLKCYGTGTGISNCLNVANVYAYACTVGVNIEFLSEFHRFTNVDCRGCYYGCINNGGNNVFVNCGFSKNIVGLLMDNTNGQSPNNSHGTFSGCVFNHSGDDNDGTAIHIIGCNNGEMFVGCQIFFGATVIENSSGIVFSACNYKGSTGSPITISGGGLVKLVDCVFGDTASITKTNNIATVVSGCYLKDGTAVVIN